MTSDLFSDSVIENLGYYVYILVDPRNNKPFYVGKGVGNRVFAHMNDTVTDETKVSLKQSLIRDIQHDGKQVEIYIARHGLNGDEAFEVESTLIDFIQLRNLSNEVEVHEEEKQLTNIVLGHHAAERGLMTLNEIQQLYGAEEAEITDPVIIININRKYTRGMSPEEIYGITRASWKVSATSAAKATYALASFRGIIKEVFTISEWVPVEGGRMAFNGEIAVDGIAQKYRNRAIASYMKVGAQNPVRYVNC